MKKFTADLLSQMHWELQKISIDTDDKLQLAERSYYIVGTHMKALKDFISSYEFKSKEEEILFFKETKPMFQKELIYFDELFAIESDKPFGRKKKLKKYYAECLVAIEVFFARNHDLYKYYRTGKVYSDESYFLRDGSSTQQQIYSHDLDPNFSTPYSITLSKLQAYEQLREFLLNAMEFKEQLLISDNTGKKRANFTWTDSNAALIELVYGIYTKGSVNFGEVAFKKLISGLEVFFNIRLGNVYPVINGFNIRKKGRTPYIDSVKQSLENKFDEKDE